MTTAICPACGARFSLRDDINISERMRCPECGALLEFTGRGPFFVEWVEENWGYADQFEAPSVEKIIHRHPRQRRETKVPAKRRNRDGKTA